MIKPFRHTCAHSRFLSCKSSCFLEHRLDLENRNLPRRSSCQGMAPPADESAYRSRSWYFSPKQPPDQSHSRASKTLFRHSSDPCLDLFCQLVVGCGLGGSEKSVQSDNCQ